MAPYVTRHTEQWLSLDAPIASCLLWMHQTGARGQVRRHGTQEGEDLGWSVALSNI